MLKDILIGVFFTVIIFSAIKCIDYIFDNQYPLIEYCDNDTVQIANTDTIDNTFWIK